MKIVAWTVLLLTLSAGLAFAQEELPQGETGEVLSGISYQQDIRVFGIALAAALTMGLAALGAGYAIGHAGSAAMGAIAEKPEVSTWGLIIVALAEGIALYGLVIAFMFIGKLPS
jgi:V/A-type H+-transporting ATPase subunit K